MLLRDDIYDAIRADILECRLQPGAELREQALAGQYQVSKSPVREALLRLEREQLVSVQSRQGYRVAPIDLAAARDLLRFRAVLEPACAAAAACEASDGAVAELEAFTRFEGDAESFIAYNRRFHAALAGASGNRRMAAAARDLFGQADRLVRASLDTIRGRDPERLVAEHAGIVAAIRARDARRAERLVREHLKAAERRILEALGRRVG